MVTFYLQPGVRNRKFYLMPGIRNGTIYVAPNDSYEKFSLAVKGLTTYSAMCCFTLHQIPFVDYLDDAVKFYKKCRGLSVRPTHRLSSSLQHQPTCNSLPVLRIQSLVDLIKEVEWCRIALLDGEDEGQCDEGLLTAGQLLHISHLSPDAGEWHLQTRYMAWCQHPRGTEVY